MSSWLRLGSEVASALSSASSPFRSRLVLLESAILTHGLPRGSNLEVAQRLESLIRKEGAVPATVAMLDGRLHVGLSPKELEHVCTSSDCFKVSSRDLALARTEKWAVGGTTVAATLRAAAMLNWPPVFVTGGIGGVHKTFDDTDNTKDVSNDLFELANSLTAVVCAGVKSILDINNTLEYLETLGVLVTTLSSSKSTAFPAFYTRLSSSPSPSTVANVEMAVRLFDNHRRTNTKGLLMAVPIPEQNSLDVDGAIEQALKEAKKERVRGKAVTPFVLNRINELTNGKTLEANIALVENNAKVGAKIAVMLANLEDTEEDCQKNNELNNFNAGHEISQLVHVKEADQTTGNENKTSESINTENTDNEILDREIFDNTRTEFSRPWVAGGSLVDVIVQLTDGEEHSMEDYETDDEVNVDQKSNGLILDGRTHMGRFSLGLGGVGRNMADALAALEADPVFVSVVGDDDHGKAILEGNSKLDCSEVRVVSGSSSASCHVMLDQKGECQVGVACNLDILDHLSPSYLRSSLNKYLDEQGEHPVVVLDGNLSVGGINALLDHCLLSKAKPLVLFEPTDLTVANRPAKRWKAVTYVTPNLNELRVMAGTNANKDNTDNDYDKDDEAGSLRNLLRECVALAKPLLDRIQVIVVTLGPQGVLLVRRGSRDSRLPLHNDSEPWSESSSMSATYYPLRPMSVLSTAQSVSGAGDCFVAAFLVSLINDGHQDAAVGAGLQAARLSLLDKQAVPKRLSPQALKWNTKPRSVDLI